MQHNLRIEMERYGEPDVLQLVERPAPEPGAGEAIVRVVASGVNRADLFIRSGAWQQAGGWPYVPGLELAGVVEAVAGDVSSVTPGDQVITMMQRLGGIHGERAGGYQRHAAVPAGTLARVPDGLSVADAAALGLPAVTALLSLEQLDVAPGMRVLVHAGSSAVGSMALRLLRARGVDAASTSTSPAKFDFILDAGASRVANTRDDSWPVTIGPVDRVLDLVGAATFPATVELLQPGGRLVFAGGTSGGELALPGWALMRPVTLTGWSSETLSRAQLQDAIDQLATLVASGDLAVPDCTSFPLSDAAAAHATMERGERSGRFLLQP